MTGDISVWPNADRMFACGNTRDMSSSRLTDAGAAPHVIVRSDCVRRVASGWAHMTCHWAGTRNTPVTPSVSITSSVVSASNGAVGMITVARAEQQRRNHPADPGDVEQRHVAQRDRVGARARPSCGSP